MFPSAPPTERQRLHVNRRKVVAAGAWTVPAIAVAAAAPAFAASTCGAVPFESGWAVAFTGSFNAGSGAQGYSTAYASAANQAVPVDSINRYVSERDNSVVSDNSQLSAANNATIKLERTLTLVPLRAYTFSFSVASRFAGDNSATSQNQYLQIQTVEAGAVTDRLKLSKGENAGTYLGNVATAGYTPLPVLTATASPALNRGVRSQVYAFSYTPPAGVSAVTLRYVWTLPALGRAVGATDYTGNSDIAVSAPTITGVGC